MPPLRKTSARASFFIVKIIDRTNHLLILLEPTIERNFKTGYTNENHKINFMECQRHPGRL